MSLWPSDKNMTKCVDSSLIYSSKKYKNKILSGEEGLTNVAPDFRDCFVNLLRIDSNCLINQECAQFITQKDLAYYELSHQLMYFMIARGVS
jgi:hypothetical protein